LLAGARGFTISARGVEVYFEDEGEGRPLLLIMGIGGQMIHWPRPFLDILIDAGYRVIRFDNRDVGRSSKLRDAGTPDVRRMLVRGLLKLPVEAPYTFSDMAADGVAVLEHLGLDRAHVMGMSLGGMVAQQLAIDHPGRVMSMTSVMSSPGDLRHAVGSPRAIAALLQKPPRTRAEASRSAISFFRAVGSTKHRPDLEGIAARAALGFERALSPDGFARQFAAMIASGSRTRGLRRLDVPTLVIHGDADPLVPPRAGRATARAVPGSRLVMIEGMGHDLPPSLHHRIVELVRLHTTGAERLAG
jgi:pimeloyl-ACP methyl ester carboxylesterase